MKIQVCRLVIALAIAGLGSDSELDAPKREVPFASINGQYRGGIVDRLFSLVRRCVLIPQSRLSALIRGP